MPLPPIFSIFGGFSFAFVVPCLPPCLACLFGQSLRLSLVCLALLSAMLAETNKLFQLSFKYLHIFHCNILYFIYHHLLILPPYTFPPSITFFLYHTFPFSSPPSILSPSLLSFLYTSTTSHAFLYVLLVQSCKDIIIYLVQQSTTCPGDHHYLFYRFLMYVLFLCIFILVRFFLFALHCLVVTYVTFYDPFVSNIMFAFTTFV